MKQIEKILFSKKSKCPYCGINLRFPVHKGKKLKITCPNCKNSFIIEIQNNPFTILKQVQHIRDIKKLYNENPLVFYSLLVIVLLILYFIFNLFFGSGGAAPEAIPTDGKII